MMKEHGIIYTDKEDIDFREEIEDDIFQMEGYKEFLNRNDQRRLAELRQMLKEEIQKQCPTRKP
jgi:hypothetical protein